jgi:threonine synthase
MKYYSTNKKSKPVSFKEALMKGLAEDGGLFMPNEIRQISNFKLQISNSGKFATQILNKFIDIPERKLEKICDNAFNFPVPLVKLDKNLYVLELFHGPTLSFKDFGARFMARAMNYYANQESRIKNKGLNIIVATSGDTGSAAANAFYGLKNIKVFVLYPSGRISPLQEKQIAALGKNIYALEVKGDFDACQKLTKQALADKELRKKITMSSANSINIGRLLPQVFYYFAGYRQYCGLRKTLGLAKTLYWPILIVPSGNFGNLTAGLFAKKIGLPVKKFIAAVNINSVVPEYLKSGCLQIKKTITTMSNAMDVGNPSNFARILDLYKHDRKTIKKDLKAIKITEPETKNTIRKIYKKYRYLADPHTAVGIAAALKYESRMPMIVLATAHPAKFKDTVEKIIGRKIELPESLKKIANAKKNSVSISKNYAEFQKILKSSA